MTPPLTRTTPRTQRSYRYRRSAVPLALACVVTLLLVACVPQTETALDLTGTWRGSWVSEAGSGGDLSADLEQAGSTLTGTMTISDSPCFKGGETSGTVSGSKLIFGTIEDVNVIKFTAPTLTQSEMSGTYSVDRGQCAGDRGTFVLRR